MYKRAKLPAVALAAAALSTLVACGGKQEAAAPAPAETPPSTIEVTTPPPASASATLAPQAGGTIQGEVRFTGNGEGVTIMAHIEGAPPGPHGLHVHETGDCSAADFTSAGGHFNPTDAPHGAPTDMERHAGDLGNVQVGGDGSAHVEMTSDMLSVGDGANSVVGRAVILHEKADDFVTQPTGAAGGRIACGVVELQAAG